MFERKKWICYGKLLIDLMKNILLKKCLKSSYLRVQTGMVSNRRNTPEKKLEKGENVTLSQGKKKAMKGK